MKTRPNTVTDLMANRSQLPVEEKRNADCKIGFINMVNYYCVDGCISRRRGSNTNGMSSSVSIRNTFNIAVKAGFFWREIKLNYYYYI